jgi:hypothetical protein
MTLFWINVCNNINLVVMSCGTATVPMGLPSVDFTYAVSQIGTGGDPTPPLRANEETMLGTSEAIM